jgi:1-acyl-sn-glycerol-3-phosphate acyltransferase
LIKSIRAAVKLALYVSATLGLYSVWFVANPFVTDKVRWRQRIFYLWVMSFVRASGMRIEVTGTPPEAPFFLVTNHLSYTDIGALRAVVAGVFVAKAEVRNWFLAGRICRDIGTIFIDRANRRDIPRAGEEILERLDAGEGVIVFPEGTSTAGKEVLPFNSSFFEFAARADLPVHYAALGYATPDAELPASIAVCWGEEISFFVHLWRLFKLPEYTAFVNFGGEPVKDHDRKVLAAELHRRVVEKFVPVV